MKRHEQWTVGDRVIYLKKDECVIKDILYDSYPPRVRIKRLKDNQSVITEFTKLQPFGPLITVDAVNDKGPPLGARKVYPFNDREQQIS